jgi:hypothetical protein
MTMESEALKLVASFTAGMVLVFLVPVFRHIIVQSILHPFTKTRVEITENRAYTA